MIARLRISPATPRRVGDGVRAGLPLLVLFSAGTIEMSRLLLLTQKLQSAAFTLSDLTARIADDDGNRTETLHNVFLAIEQVIQPFDFSAHGQSIVTSIRSPAADGTPVVGWQCLGSGSLAVGSEIGEPAHSATLPATLGIRKGETIVAAEVYFDFHPLFGLGFLPARVVRRVAYFKPRLGELATLACPVS